MNDYKTVAMWLYDKIMTEDYVSQQSAVYDIVEMFGDKFTYTNENGNLAINRQVLKEFGRLKGDNIVWDRSTRTWHQKTDRDQELERLSNELHVK